MKDDLLEQWEANAKAFTALINNKGTPHHREILNPCIERVMGNVAGKRLLDAGCGEGYLARHYARRGAQVVGVDFSSSLIDICKKMSKDLEIKFHVGDICDLNFIHNAQFHLILCNLVLLNVDCYEAALQEFHRVLKAKGSLIFSIVHPAFNIYGPGRWKLGEKNRKTQRRKGHHFIIDDYFIEKEYRVRWKSLSGEEFPQEFSFFHRTISSYIRALRKAGFTITALEEPQPVTDNPFFERESRIPFFLVLRAEKLNI